jgi:hypothetical protein
MGDLTREEMAAHMDGLKLLINSRFDATDEKFEKINGRVGKTEDRVTKVETDVVKIKTVWTGLVALGTFTIEFLRHRITGAS